MPAVPATPYCGRFAPSPTGQLHFGSLVAAVGSYADAKAHGGYWQVRIDDLDHTRVIPTAAADILRTLDAFGLHWDGAVSYQSQHGAYYTAALEQLRAVGHCYSCTCSRRTIAATARHGHDSFIYPGTCRHSPPIHHRPYSERLRTLDACIAVVDRIHGVISQNIYHDVGDFIIRRADGIIAYQFAVVIDDALQQVNNIVRGADLLYSTPRQCYLQQLLGIPRPAYAHVPLILDTSGQKLSKTAAAAPVLAHQPLPALHAAWYVLGQTPLPAELTTVTEFWQYAPLQWSLTAVGRVAVSIQHVPYQSPSPLKNNGHTFKERYDACA